MRQPVIENVLEKPPIMMVRLARLPTVAGETCSRPS